MGELKGKPLAFALAYIKNGRNGPKAAIDAGYAESSAHVRASLLIRNDKVLSFIAEIDQKEIKKAGVTVEKVLKGIDEVACSDLALCMNTEGEFLPIKEIPEHVRRCIASVEMGYKKVFIKEEGDWKTVPYVKKLSLWSKTRAQEMLGRHLKMFTDKVEVSGSLGFADQLKAARERGNNGKKQPV